MINGSTVIETVFRRVGIEKGCLLPWRSRVIGASRWLKQGADEEPGLKGWGLIVPAGIDPIYMVVLRRLLEHRQEAVRQTGGALEIYRYNRSDGPRLFLERHGFLGPKSCKPFYLLIIGSDHLVPSILEDYLAPKHAVGRLDLDIPEDYYNYANALVKSETRKGRMHGVTLLNYREDGSQVARQLMARQVDEPRRWMITEMATHPTGQGEALTLKLAPSDQRVPIEWDNHDCDMSGHLVFQLGGKKERPSLEGGYASFQTGRQLLSSPTQAALAMVRMKRAAVHALKIGLPGVLDGLPLGAAMGREYGMRQCFTILGDPAVRLNQGRI